MIKKNIIKHKKEGRYSCQLKKSNSFRHYRLRLAVITNTTLSYSQVHKFKC